MPTGRPSLPAAQAAFHARIILLHRLLLAANIPYRCTCSHRSTETQAALYARGRTAPGPVITNARPLHSPHNWGLAHDYAILIAGKPIWSTRHPHWRKFVICVRAVGLLSGSTFPGLADYAHVELHAWRHHIKWT